MKKYLIHKTDNESALSDLVNKSINEGYVPIGGVAVRAMNESLAFYQAVYLPDLKVKKTKEKEQEA